MLHKYKRDLHISHISFLLILFYHANVYCFTIVLPAIVIPLASKVRSPDDIASEEVDL
jgi:hypothetical protein